MNGIVMTNKDQSDGENAQSDLDEPFEAFTRR